MGFISQHGVNIIKFYDKGMLPGNINRVVIEFGL